jgi:hypothetical protein
VNQQINFWTKHVTEPGSLSKKSAPPCTPQATFMIQCESREWTQRYKAKIKQLGKVKAQSWWFQVKADILRIRGQDGLNILTNEINRQQHETRSKD